MYNSTTDNTNNSQQEYEQQQQQTYTYQPVDNYNSNVNTNPQYFNYSTYYDASSQYQPTSLNNYNQTYYHNYYQTPQLNFYQYQQNPEQFNNYTYPVQNPKPSTPTPTVQYTQTSPQTESQTTPEKPVMNDSGIVISPQIATMVNQFQNNQDYIAPVQQNSSTDNSDENEDESIGEDDEELNTSNKENDEENESKSSSKSSKMNPAKPPKPYLEIIADAILSCNVKMMQLHEIYNYMEKKYQYFAKNVNKSWRNSVRHNLSLNECFVKAGRGSNGKGNYWKIHPLCEKEFIRGNFRRKSFKQLIRAGQNQNNQNGYNSNHPSAVSYSLPADYTLNFRSISSLIPPPIPQQLNNNNNNLASFQYSMFNQEQLASFNQQYNEQQTNKQIAEAKLQSVQRFHPYRV